MGRFKPVEYFGGYKSEDIGTGIIRKIMIHMFAPERKERSIKPSPNHNNTVSQDCKNMAPRLYQQKASHSQAELDPSKYPNLAEISSSLHTSQSRINQLMNNLQSLKCSGNSKDRNQISKGQNSSFMKSKNPKVIR